MGSSRRVTLALAALLALVLVGWLVREHATGDESDTGLPVRALSELPAQAADTWRLIQRGGPFPHDEDGTVFGNRELRLPHERSGYYHEYTVETPGSADRGARRLVTGSAGELYYTKDHYASFVAVDPDR